MRRTTAIAMFLTTSALGAQRPVPAPLPAQAPMPAIAPRTNIDVYTMENRIAAMNIDADVQPRFSMTMRNWNPDWVPQAWVKGDPADSLYRLAREQLNRGDYRKAAALFRDLPVKFPNSEYVADAPYWQAFALYRVGGTAELQEALTALETQKTKYPRARTQADASGLAVRIAGALSQRGLAGDAMVKRALTSGGNDCDREEQSVRAEALSALTQTDPDAAQQLTRKILARKDECSVPLRRNAIWILANKPDAQTTATLISVAKSDPSADVRSNAVSYLSRMPGDDALAALEDFAKSADNEPVQRAAVRALGNHPNPRARVGVRALIEKNDAPEGLRLAALDMFDRDRSTTDDATWLRATYGKVDNVRVKARIASVIGRIGGDANTQWLMTLVSNEEESLEVRSSALSRAGQTVDIATLTKIYDATPQRLRRDVINILGERKEPEATDKLISIVKNGTDPQLRSSAISALTRKKDPRTTKLLMELIDR